jgi:microcystin-dependent protein
MANWYLGELRLFGFGFAPRGWVQCNGQTLPISTNTALFSIIGTFYGGNGVSTFMLPDLRAFVPIGTGQGPGLSDFAIGQSGGGETETLATVQIPSHTHALTALPVSATSGNAQGGSILAEGKFGGRGSGYRVFTYTTNPPATTLNASASGPQGGNMPHPNVQPTLTMNWCIAVTGIFPPRG